MSKEAEAQALDALKPFLNSEGVRRFADYFRARRETLRDRLEAEESEQTRGRTHELRDLLKLLSE